MQTSSSESDHRGQQNAPVLSGLIRDNLCVERSRMGGIQRIYRFPCGAGLSVVNSSMLHSYPFAWEAAVLKGVEESGDFADLDYSTPLTSDVEVFMSDEETNEFIKRAAIYFAGQANSVSEDRS